MTQQVATYAFRGGIDTNSAALATPPAMLIHGLNYEPLAEGYGRVDGYERFDGRGAPSNEAYFALQFTEGAETFEIGDVVTGGLSGATGTVLVDPYGVTGDVGDNDAEGTVVLGSVSGTFQAGEALQVSAVTYGTLSGSAVEGGAPSIALDRLWLAAAQEAQRALIAAVPGAGSVRGVAVHNGTVYAWRDNIGQTECLGYRATAAGWVALTQSRRIAFTSGLAAGIEEGDTVTGLSSGATGVVIRIDLRDGDWSSNDAQGWLHITGQTGTFGSETLRVGGTNRATGTASVLSTFAPGGRYRCISHNFYGAANLYRLYGATGVSNAFEMVGHVMVPIFTGMDDDTPTHIFEIANHLGLCFPGGSVQISGTAEPLAFDVLLGAAEIGLGTEITDVSQANESAVALFGQQKVAMLTGRDSASFELAELTEEAGADADTVQRIARTVYMDRRGLRSLDATQAYGDFKAGTLSGRFETYLKKKRTRGVTALGSIVSRAKSQYRLFWSDGTGLAVYMGNKEPEAIPFDYGFTPTCFASGELVDGEGLFVGASDGRVYRLDSGTSYDGTGIVAACMLPFNHFGSTRQQKRFHKVMLELQGSPQASIRILAQYDYGDSSAPVDYGSDFDVRAGGGLWDVSYWDDFYWDDPVSGTAECFIDGVGRNASFVFSSNSDATEPAHILQAYSVHFSPRGMLR